jgi:hypothetical protein
MSGAGSLRPVTRVTTTGALRPESRAHLLMSETAPARNTTGAKSLPLSRPFLLACRRRHPPVPDDNRQRQTTIVSAGRRPSVRTDLRQPRTDVSMSYSSASLKLKSTSE